jgi:diaminohydroxyphosphoribosylaminopyrimidine deaminase/5-amino-6-(5-phosphoribosylamino)uracil reductase
LLACGQADPDGAAARALRDSGAEIVCLPGPAGKVDLPALLQHLGQRGINELHVEAGHKLNASLLRERLVDELLLYLAPKLIGPGRDLAALDALQSLDGVQNWDWQAVDPIGSDLRLRLRPIGGWH